MSDRHPCFTQVNEALAPANGRLAFGLGITPELGIVERLLIGTEKVDKTKRKPAPLMSAAFCPFCGVKLGAPERAETAAVQSPA